MDVSVMTKPPGFASTSVVGAASGAAEVEKVEVVMEDDEDEVSAEVDVEVL